MTDQAGRRKFGCSLNKLKAQAHRRRNPSQESRLAGSWRPFQQHVPVSRKRRDYQFSFAASSEDLSRKLVDDQSSSHHVTGCFQS